MWRCTYSKSIVCAKIIYTFTILLLQIVQLLCPINMRKKHPTDVWVPKCSFKNIGRNKHGRLIPAKDLDSRHKQTNTTVQLHWRLYSGRVLRLVMYSICEHWFYPRDAMLGVCLCLSQVGVLLKWLDGPSWFFGKEAFFDQPTLCYKEIQVFKNKGTSLWNLFLNSELKKFHYGVSIVERAMNLARERWTVVGN